MSGVCERGFMLMFKKFGILGALSELLEPHLFGRTEAFKFGAIGAHPMKNSFEPLKVQLYTLGSLFVLANNISFQPFAY